MNQFEDLSQKLMNILPKGLQNLEHNIQLQFKEILQSAFMRMNLVTREEFDVQVKVLERTREKVDALKTQLDALLEKKENV